MKSFRKSFLLAAAFAAGVAGARASTEVGGFGGWRFGGSFNDAEGQSHTAEPAGSWGGVLDVYLSPDAALEIMISRQETEVRFGGDQPSSVPLTIDHYQIGGLKEYEGGKFRPFLAGLLGWSHIKSEDISTDRFSMTMGGGAKYYFTSRLGCRADLRAHVIVGNNSVTAASSGPNGGSVSFAGEVMVQGEAAAGIFLVFGGPRESGAPHRRESNPFDDF